MAERRLQLLRNDAGADGNFFGQMLQHQNLVRSDGRGIQWPADEPQITEGLTHAQGLVPDAWKNLLRGRQRQPVAHGGDVFLLQVGQRAKSQPVADPERGAQCFIESEDAFAGQGVAGHKFQCPTIRIQIVHDGAQLKATVRIVIFKRIEQIVLLDLPAGVGKPVAGEIVVIGEALCIREPQGSPVFQVHEEFDDFGPRNGGRCGARSQAVPGCRVRYAMSRIEALARSVESDRQPAGESDPSHEPTT